MENLVIEYAPVVVLIIIVCFQYHVFITPVELEKKHREILNDIEEKFVSWVAFRSLKDTVEGMDNKISKIFEILVERNKDI